MIDLFVVSLLAGQSTTLFGDIINLTLPPLCLFAMMLLCAYIKYVNIQIHSGFYKLFKEIYPSILSQVRNSRPRRVIVTGHSLGAGLAQLVAFALSFDYECVSRSGLRVIKLLFAMD